MKIQRRGLNKYNALSDRWKYEAKEDHQLSPGGPRNRRKSSGPNY